MTSSASTMDGDLSSFDVNGMSLCRIHIPNTPSSVISPSSSSVRYHDHPNGGLHTAVLSPNNETPSSAKSASDAIGSPQPHSDAKVATPNTVIRNTIGFGRGLRNNLRHTIPMARRSPNALPAMNPSMAANHVDSSSSTLSAVSTVLALSETPLTPNQQMEIPETHEVVSNFDAFKLDPDADVEADAEAEHQDEKKETKAELTNQRRSLPIASSTFSAGADEDMNLSSVSTGSACVQKDEDEYGERSVLTSHGFRKLRKMGDTLQGSVFLAHNKRANEQLVVIKRTSKQLHERGITIQDGEIFEVHEDVLKEFGVLKVLSSEPHCPAQIAKMVDFFESEHNYYLVMEHGGYDFFEFIVEAHRLIQANKLKAHEWLKFVKYLFYQLASALHWLHHTMHCCHLDISLENITVQNGNFVVLPNGECSVDPEIKIKFIDFGLAEFFNPLDAFQCVKYCGKTAYKCPEVYRQKMVFDARKADIWSLGVVLFCMAVGSPPYMKPSNSDPAFYYFIKTANIDRLLIQWNRGYCVTTKMLNLMHQMLRVDAGKRSSVEDVMTHPWLNAYHKQFKQSFAKTSVARAYRSIFHDLMCYQLPTKFVFNFSPQSAHK
eukprot:CAMPEP_0202733614 /NCGR_PEP_ID=MMETSP1385-20130828/188259_1 /ASSEMBLY_ACC=CAM_ASM_000861 /TAXON_ID=933848 /ORGANISM="Elphidium margaritaceum" /LENGTH=604 /DNA_ID=CAMNT_0049399953 /DNA_START=107 /DNA_END=1921 /DNA_ORIENTATION=+